MILQSTRRQRSCYNENLIPELIQVLGTIYKNFEKREPFLKHNATFFTEYW
jgi:hypothetical protein